MNIPLNTLPSPCFVLDEKILLWNLDVLEEVRDRAGITIIPALKGFAMWKTFPEIKKRFQGAAVSSLHETLLCKDELGVKSFAYAPVYKEVEIDTILKLSSHISFNSLGQWELFREKLHRFPDVSAGIRVNPGFSPVETDLYNPCVDGSRLGVSFDALNDAMPEGLEGIHIHSLCESGFDHLAELITIIEKKGKKFLSQIKWLNLGGGHLMTRSGYDKEGLINLLKRLKLNYDIEIILEPGSAFAWRAGYLVATVLDIVEHTGIQTAMLDTSFAAHMPDCLEMPYQPDVIGATKGSGNYQYRLGGNSCLAGDYIGMYGFEAPLKVGDKLVFGDMMHYTMVKTNHFNGVAHPSIGILHTNGEFELWREFGYEDYKNRLS
ncbi:MAG: carboxynorspermidine decarboxylase [Fibrobacteria bacterium]|nr:carboxynorspermidine decarboxylase [Fibrobacteria bacterium]